MLYPLEIIGTIPAWNENYHGIMQIFVLYCILNQLKRTGVVAETETV